jgi:DNA processing protein
MINIKNNKINYIALSLLKTPLWVKSSLLRQAQFDVSKLWKGQSSEIDQRWKTELLNFNAWKEAEEIFEKTVDKGIQIITADDEKYPDTLKNTHDFPVILFCMGNTSLLQRENFAVVGTRLMSSYGRVMVSKFVPGLVGSGFCIVSGMARGIDAQVHITTIKEGGSTIAVLGSSVDKPSPYQNKSVYDEILKSDGLIVSEYHPGSEVHKGNFPQRNRIIAGLSKGVLVVEAGEKSGSLITASFAGSYNRDVFAIPGHVNSPSSFGTNKLIKKGAIIATETKDITEQYGLLFKDNEEFKDKTELNEIHKRTLGMVASQGVDLNELMLVSGIPMPELLKSLEELEHTGYIGKDGFGVYYLN